MVYKTFIEEVRAQVKKDLNGFLSSHRLPSVEVFENNPSKIANHDKTLAIYAYNPNGPVMEMDSFYTTVKFTLHFWINQCDDAQSNASVEDYFSALAYYINHADFSEFDRIVDNQIDRMDMGDPCNEVLFLVESRINSQTDYDEEYPTPASDDNSEET